jgi:hypothetical protein
MNFLNTKRILFYFLSVDDQYRGDDGYDRRFSYPGDSRGSGRGGRPFRPGGKFRRY